MKVNEYLNQNLMPVMLKNDIKYYPGSRNRAARQRGLLIILDLVVKKKYYYLTLYASLFAFHF